MTLEKNKDSHYQESEAIGAHIPGENAKWHIHFEELLVHFL
jgi:hypothetical protein